ncbi:uncharacterized protein V6R79_000333 [Siganus canaliculatus]
MRKKYGDKSLKYLNVWTAEFEFPLGGSLSLSKIGKIEEKLKKEEHEMVIGKKKMCFKKLYFLKEQNECLQIWKKEAEIRNRKMHKQLLSSCEKDETKEQLSFSHEKDETKEKPPLAREKDETKTQLPISHEKEETKKQQDVHTQRATHSQISSSFYPQLTALKLDPDLDDSPPTHPPAPPPYNITKPNEARGTTQQGVPLTSQYPVGTVQQGVPLTSQYPVGAVQQGVPLTSQYPVGAVQQGVQPTLPYSAGNVQQGMPPTSHYSVETIQPSMPSTSHYSVGTIQNDTLSMPQNSKDFVETTMPSTSKNIVVVTQHDTPPTKKDSIICPSSPIAHRLRHHTQQTTFSMPMVEVSGPEGPTLVFRAWTSADLTTASQHLPNLTTSGKVFAEELLTFCKEFKPTSNELRRLLIPKLKLSDWDKISNQIPMTDLRCKHVDWENASNTEYTGFVHKLCSEITKAFPIQIDLDEVLTCKQKDNESPNEYLTRLTEIFKTHSGIQIPNQLGNTRDVWEIHLCNCFLNGLKPDIASAVKHSCIGWKGARLSMLRDHASHAYDLQLSKKKKRDETTERGLHMASMTMLNMAKDHKESNYNYRGRRPNPQKNRRRQDDACFLCGQYGHWKRDCPQNKSSHSEETSD